MTKKDELQKIIKDCLPFHTYDCSQEIVDLVISWVRNNKDWQGFNPIEYDGGSVTPNKGKI